MLRNTTISNWYRQRQSEGSRQTVVLPSCVKSTPCLSEAFPRCLQCYYYRWYFYCLSPWMIRYLRSCCRKGQVSQGTWRKHTFVSVLQMLQEHSCSLSNTNFLFFRRHWLDLGLLQNEIKVLEISLVRTLSSMQVLTMLYFWTRLVYLCSDYRKQSWYWRVAIVPEILWCLLRFLASQHLIERRLIFTDNLILTNSW